ncbi:MAG: hypothetical protein V1914_04555 [archaeon]
MKLKAQNKIWTALFWIGVLLLLGWALGKSLGLINSPVWVEMLPYFGVGFSLTAGGVKLGRALEKLDFVCKDVHDMKKDIREIQRNANCLRGENCSFTG